MVPLTCFEPSDSLRASCLITIRDAFARYRDDAPGAATFLWSEAYGALSVDLQRTLDDAAAAVQVYSGTDFHLKNAIALERLRTEFRGKVEILQFPAPVLRDLRKLAAEVIKEQSEKTPMARKVHASFTKFQALVGPWDHVAEGAYHQFVAS